MNKKNLILSTQCAIVIGLLLAGSLRGWPDLTTQDMSPGSPFESSNNNSRYALVQAMVHDRTFILDTEKARFSSPDVSKLGDRYFSIFTPGVSFLGLPFYLAGRFLGNPQLVTYLSVTLLALVNFFLVVLLARRLGATVPASLLSGSLFLFGSNALSYATTFTQHHPSTTVILLSLLISGARLSLWRDLLFGLLFGIGLLLDIPNVFFLAPPAVYLMYRHFEFNYRNPLLSVRFNPRFLVTFLGIAAGILVLIWYNLGTTGSPFLLAQFVGTTDDFVFNPVGPDPTTLVQEESQIVRLPLNTRKQLNGFYTLLVSNERGWFYYSSFIVFGLWGLYEAYRRQQSRNSALLYISLISVMLVIYSMFGDPWGGWSFGPRYLIPATAVACIPIGLIVTRFRKNLAFTILFWAAALWSIFLSSLGALTTNLIPPKKEASGLSVYIPYTPLRNVEMMNQGRTSSLFYNTFLVGIGTLDSRRYISIYAFVAFSLIILLYLSVKPPSE